jgi:hypothetical protein
MIIMMTENRRKDMTKRLRRVLRGLGVDLRHTDCLELAARLCGFAARDAFQMAVLETAGLGAVARELLDRANPTGSWAKQPTEEPVWGGSLATTRSS